MLFFYKEYNPENIRVTTSIIIPVKSERDMGTIHQKLARRKGIFSFVSDRVTLDISTLDIEIRVEKPLLETTLYFFIVIKVIS